MGVGPGGLRSADPPPILTGSIMSILDIELSEKVAPNTQRSKSTASKNSTLELEKTLGMVVQLWLGRRKGQLSRWSPSPEPFPPGSPFAVPQPGPVPTRPHCLLPGAPAG